MKVVISESVIRMDNNNNSLGKRIAALREQAGLSQFELARRLDVSASSIAMWETGDRGVRTAMLAKLAAFFQVRTDDLIGLTDPAATHSDEAKEEPLLRREPSGEPEPGDDPEIGLFFKDFRNAPKERREEMIRFWRFIQEREQGRKPGDEQEQ